MRFFIDKLSHIGMMAMGLVATWGIARAADVYIAQSPAGVADGTSCANALIYTFFNSASNWGSGKQIAPGTTVHLCGTFTATAGTSGYLAVQGSGSSGNPVTIRFETGAIIQAPYWGANGAIFISGKSYITVDGGTNGLIQATLNGSSGGACPGGTCTNQQGSGIGISLNQNTAIEIKNLTIGDLYDHTSNTDTVGASGGTYAIQEVSGSGTLIHNNTFHDMKWSVFVIANPGTAESSLSIYSNAVYNCSVGFIGGDGGPGGVITGPVLVYSNTVHDAENWDTTTDAFHHDGVYIFITNSASSFTGLYVVYNNYFYNLGTNCSAAIYFDPGATSTYPSPYAFNNIITSISGCGDGAFYDKSGKMRLYNNTILSGTIDSVAGSASTILENNISEATEGIWLTTASLYISDYNDWYGTGNPAIFLNGTDYSSIAGFVSSTGFDTHSITSNPNLNSNYIPNSGSPVIGMGTNLTSICNNQPNPGLGALCYDKASSARPPIGGWDIGAYNSASSTTTLPPPTNLTLITN